MYEFLRTVAQPYPVLLITLGASIAYAWCKRKVHRRALVLMTVTWTAILLLSMPLVTQAMFASLTQKHAPPEDLPADVDAIVTLGGGLSPPAQFRDRAQVDGSSYGRCLHTVAIYKYLEGRPVIVCGGPSRRVVERTPVAEVMADMLTHFGVARDDIILDDESLSTYENAVNAAKLLRDRNLKKTVLVTDSRHMPRAVMCLRKQGVQVIPAPSDYSTKKVDPPFYEMIVPSSGSLVASHKVFHEWLGMLWYWIHGRI